MATPVASGPEFQINTFTTLHQSDSNVTALPNGGFLITWSSLRQGDDEGTDIYAQRYDSTGAAVGDEFLVNTSSPVPWQQKPAANALGDGGFVITWNSINQGDGGGVYGQRFDSDGAAIGEEFLINSATSGSQRDTAMTLLDNGDLIITWSSFGKSEGSAFFDRIVIAAQRYDSTGLPIGEEFVVSTSTDAGSMTKPAISSFADGGYVITWQSQGLDNAGEAFGSGIYGQRYDTSGAPVGGEFQVNTMTVGDQNLSSVTTFGNGNFVVIWSSSPEIQGDGGAPAELLGQLYGADGAPIGGEFQVNSSTEGKQEYSAVTELDDGGFVVTWSTASVFVSGEGWTHFDISGQRYNAEGEAVGGEFIINTYSTSTLARPSITTLEDGRLVVTWMSLGQDGDNFGVFGQILSIPDGETITGTDGNDRLIGTADDDVIAGGLGNDFLRGGLGADALDGGAGRDAAAYTKSATGVSIDLAAGTASGGAAEGDMLTSIERLIGSDFDDVLVGDGNRNVLTGRDGDDSLSGGDGNDGLTGGQGGDMLDGGAGRDTAVYANSATGVSINLTAGTASGGEAEGDTLTSIENLTGSGFDDTLVGDGNKNTLIGGAGDDVLSGRAGNDFLRGGEGADVLRGGAGRDTADYSRSDATVRIELDTGSVMGGEAEGDTLFSIENLVGSAFADILQGNGKRNILTGNDGNDILLGGDGNDILTGGAGRDSFIFTYSSDLDRVTDYEVGSDVLNLGSDLCRGTALTNAQIVSQFASVVGGNVVFDFGEGDRLTLNGLTSTDGLAEDITVLEIFGF